MEINFILTRLPPSLNELLHKHWIHRHRLQEAFDAQVSVEWLKLGRVVFMLPVRLIYVLSFPARRVRDIDNYIGGTKLITDSLKKTFLFRDDSEWIKSIEVRFIKGKEGTAVFIKEAINQKEEAWQRKKPF
jgi:Holliday junction resolvase RusA-like endonuclease